MENGILVKVCGILTKQSKGQTLQEKQKDIYPRKYRKLGLWVAVQYGTKFIYIWSQNHPHWRIDFQRIDFFMLKKKRKGKEKKIGSVCISKEFKINLMKLTLSLQLLSGEMTEKFIWKTECNRPERFNNYSGYLEPLARIIFMKGVLGTCCLATHAL